VNANATITEVVQTILRNHGAGSQHLVDRLHENVKQLVGLYMLETGRENAWNEARRAEARRLLS
jgi:hypothetical protein